MENELNDMVDDMRSLVDANHAQLAANEVSDTDMMSWRLHLHHEAIWAMAAQQEAAYRALLSEHVVAQTAALTRIADALERVLLTGGVA